MTVPESQKLWFDALMLERPWVVNDVTRCLVARVKDKDLAAAIWAIERMNAVKWLDKKINALNGENPGSLLDDDEGRKKLWAVLEAASAWF